MQANSVIYLQYTVYDVSPEKERESVQVAHVITHSQGDLEMRYVADWDVLKVNKTKG